MPIALSFQDTIAVLHLGDDEVFHQSFSISSTLTSTMRFRWARTG
jgi:hypothetical protein